MTKFRNNLYKFKKTFFAFIFFVGFAPTTIFAADLENSEASSIREPASSLETKKTIANDQIQKETEETPTRLLNGQWRTSLSDSGFDFEAFYFFNGISNQSGGAKKGGVGISTLDTFLHFNFEKLLGWSGGSFLLQYHANGGEFINQYTGDLMGVNSYALSTNESLVSQAYLKQAWNEGSSDLLFGLYDYSSEFFVTESSLIFMNNGFLLGAETYPPAPAALSVYPINAPAMRLRLAKENLGYILAGTGSSTARDPRFTNGTHPRMGKDEGYFSILEAGLQSEFSKGVYHKLALGVWSLTNDFTKIDGSGAKAKDKGFYLLADYHIKDNLSGFARYGAANKDVASIDHTMSVGLNFAGVFAEKDQLGLGYAQTVLNSKSRQLRIDAGENLETSESAIELVYRIEPIAGFTVMPDLQKITNPSMSKDIKEATVASLRMELSF